MSRFIKNTTYPLIPNANEYIIEQRIVSIHSEDRDIIKFPDSSNFEIELPDDYCNVSTVSLGSYTFPANYNTFSLEQGNIFMTFKIPDPYNPNSNPNIDSADSFILSIIFEALHEHANQNYLVTITTGYYNPSQIANELTNQFNLTVDNYIVSYLNKNYPDLIPAYYENGGYLQFLVVYNEVTQSLWFGNKSSGFTITNDSELYKLRKEIISVQCVQKQLDDFSNWGLPPYLGFTRCPAVATPNPVPGIYPRFYYLPQMFGPWLVPDPIYATQTVYYLEAPAKINLMGDAYFYMEVAGLNTIDETSPYSFNYFTTHTNETNGVHNSAFAKIAVSTTPVAQWYDSNTEAITIFNPPAERIRKIRLKIRYHNGLIVNFGKFNYSFDLIFQLLRPQQLRQGTTTTPPNSMISPINVNKY